MNALYEIWSMLDSRQRRRLVLLQAISLLMAFSTLAGIAASMQFLAVLAEPRLIAQSRILSFLYATLGFEDQRTFVIGLGLGFAGMVLLSNAINLLGSLAMTRFALHIGDTFHGALLDEYLHRNYLFHARNNSSTLFNKVVYATNRVTSGLLESSLILITNSVTIALIVTSTLFVNALVSIAAVVWLGGIYALIYFAARRKLFNNGLLENEVIVERARIANESLGAIKEILVLGNQRFFRQRFEEACRSISRFALSNHAIAQSPKYVLECITVLGLVGTAIFVSAGRGVSSWLAELTFLGFAAYRLLPAIQQVFTSVVRIRTNRAMFESIADDLRLALRSKQHVAPAALDRSRMSPPPQEITLENVSFRYAGDAPLAVREITLRIPPGALVGFVGPNGSGKTTLVDIILGLLVPESGRVVIDETPLDDTNRAAWQSGLAYVPQNIFLLDTTIGGNIALGASAADADEERMIEAARLARLDELVRSLPGGYGEVLGERGVRLSGGQRQRVGIARALYRNASVLILDEATSSLDGLAEQEILETLQTLRSERTVILVAHRLSTVKQCDVIFELDKGTLVRSGTYDELERHSPQFRRMLGKAPGDRGEDFGRSTLPSSPQPRSKTS